MVGGIGDDLSQMIREFGLILLSHVGGNRNERGATRVTTSVNPKQSTGQPAGRKSCGLFYWAGFSRRALRPSLVGSALDRLVALLAIFVFSSSLSFCLPVPFFVSGRAAFLREMVDIVVLILVRNCDVS